jgi:hypothetical protein
VKLCNSILKSPALTEHKEALKKCACSSIQPFSDIQVAHMWRLFSRAFDVEAAIWQQPNSFVAACDGICPTPGNPHVCVSSLLYSVQTNARIRKWQKTMELENKWQSILSDCYNHYVEFRRGLAYYNLGMQKDAWNDLTQWMGSAPRYVRQQLASPNGFDLFRLHLNPEVLMAPGHTPLSNLLSSISRRESGLLTEDVQGIGQIAARHVQ